VRSEVAAFPVDGLDALRTFPVWAFHILSKGRSSQSGGIFLWKAVEKGSLGRCYAAAWALAFLSFTSASAPRRSA